MNVYRGYDQEALDREYRARATVSEAEFDRAVARYAADSARARARLDCRLDAAYGAHPDEVVDVFPAGEGAPVFVYGPRRLLAHVEPPGLGVHGRDLRRPRRGGRRRQLQPRPGGRPR